MEQISGDQPSLFVPLLNLVHDLINTIIYFFCFSQILIIIIFEDGHTIVKLLNVKYVIEFMKWST